MKKGFTLVELLVVIGIIGILGGVLMASLRGSTDSANNAKCLSNMKSLASACQTYGMSSGYYPLAGSIEKMQATNSSGKKNIKMRYYELPGWLSWNSRGVYGSDTSSHCSSAGWFTSAYSSDFDARECAYTNGVIWTCISGSKSLFQCPAHLKKYASDPPAWSYVMNSYFGWDSSEGSSARGASYSGVKFSSLSRGDKRLLFAELPFMGYEVTPDTSSGSGTKNDCVLQYETKYGGEHIGFNHKIGKRDKCAHVCFADGHVEQLLYPKSGMGSSELRELTEWLCEAKDVALNGDRYEKLD